MGGGASAASAAAAGRAVVSQVPVGAAGGAPAALAPPSAAPSAAASAAASAGPGPGPGPGPAAWPLGAQASAAEDAPARHPQYFEAPPPPFVDESRTADGESAPADGAGVPADRGERPPPPQQPPPENSADLQRLALTCLEGLENELAKDLHAIGAPKVCRKLSPRERLDQLVELERLERDLLDVQLSPASLASIVSTFSDASLAPAAMPQDLADAPLRAPPRAARAATPQFTSFRWDADADLADAPLRAPPRAARAATPPVLDEELSQLQRLSLLETQLEEELRRLETPSSMHSSLVGLEDL